MRETQHFEKGTLIAHFQYPLLQNFERYVCSYAHMYVFMRVCVEMCERDAHRALSVSIAAELRAVCMQLCAHVCIHEFISHMYVFMHLYHACMYSCIYVLKCVKGTLIVHYQYALLGHSERYVCIYLCTRNACICIHTYTFIDMHACIPAYIHMLTIAYMCHL